MNASADYQFAELLRDQLKTNPELSELVFPEIYDDALQWNDIYTAAGAPIGLLTITPSDANMPYDRPGGGHLGRMDSKFIVTAFCLNNMTSLPDNIETPAKYRAALLGQVIDVIKKWWTADNWPVVYGEPSFIALQDIPIPEIENKIPDISARALILSVNLNF